MNSRFFCFNLSDCCTFMLLLNNKLIFIEEGGFADDLPAITQSLVTLQNLVTNHWFAGIMVLVLIYSVFKLYVTSNSGAVKYDLFKLKLPLIGTLLRKIYVLRFVDLLGILVDSGLPIVDSLQTTANAIDNKIYKLKIKEIIQDVKGGKKISESMSDMYFLFSPEVVRMLEVGEKTASIGKISIKISDQYDKEIDESLKKTMSVFEPLLILFVGVKQQLSL